MSFPFKEIATFVEQHSTLLASIISMENPAAGMVIGGLSSLFGAATGSSSQLMTLMSTNPNTGSMLQQFETDNASFLAATVSAHAADLESARNREVEVIKATGKRDTTLDIIAITITGAFLLSFFLPMFFDINPSHISSSLSGSLGTCFALCISYYFGDSFQSRKFRT